MTTSLSPTTAVTFASPNAPASYTWEATDEEVAARYGIPVEDILRFDLNTSPTPPPLAERVIQAGRFATPISEYPPSDYRALVEAAAARYGVATGELLVGAGADEILDLIGKAFLPPGSASVIPTPTYAMFGVVSEQRGARVIAVPRRPGSQGWALDLDAIRDAARGAQVVWLCSPNNPTALPEPAGTIATLLGHLARDATEAGAVAPVVVLDEAYAEFVGESLADLRFRYPHLVVVRTASKAYALAGLRVGFAIALPQLIAEIAPYRPPGSVSTISVTAVTAVLRDDDALSDNLGRVAMERERLITRLREAGWRVGPSVVNFILVDFGSPERAASVADGMLRRGLVPRTFGDGHALAGYLRLTIRDAAGNDRLIEAARAIAEETP